MLVFSGVVPFRSYAQGNPTNMTTYVLTNGYNETVWKIAVTLPGGLYVVLDNGADVNNEEEPVTVPSYTDCNCVSQNETTYTEEKTPTIDSSSVNTAGTWTITFQLYMRGYALSGCTSGACCSGAQSLSLLDDSADNPVWTVSSSGQVGP